jgi:hypothetical protein
MLTRSQIVVTGVLLCACATGSAQENSFDVLAGRLSNLYRLSNAKTFSISPENLTEERGKGGMAAHGSASQAARDVLREYMF